MRHGRVFITGATGFVGSYVVEHYVRQGWDVHGTTHSPANEERSFGITLHSVDLRDATATIDLVSKVRPDVIHHLAGQSSVATSRRHPMDTMIDNISMQRYILDGALAAGNSPTVVVAGSADEYGFVREEENPIVEEQELRPTSPYALSKVAQDLMAHEYFLVHNLPVVRVRPFLQIGPRRSDTFIAGSFARQVAEVQLGIAPPVIDVGNIDQVRDLTDVRDVTTALALLADEGEPGSVYNIASGVGHSLRRLLTRMIETAGAEVDIRTDPSRLRKGEPPVFVGDATKLRRATGWQPEIPFDRSVDDTLDYWQHRIENSVLSRN